MSNSEASRFGSICGGSKGLALDTVTDPPEKDYNRC